MGKKIDYRKQMISLVNKLTKDKDTRAKSLFLIEKIWLDGLDTGRREINDDDTLYTEPNGVDL